MGSTLQVEPVGRKKMDLPYELKKVLQKKYNSTIYDAQMDESDISYLNALVDAEILGAYELIKFIEIHGSVILNEQF